MLCHFFFDVSNFRVVILFILQIINQNLNVETVAIFPLHHLVTLCLNRWHFDHKGHIDQYERNKFFNNSEDLSIIYIYIT